MTKIHYTATSLREAKRRALDLLDVLEGRGKHCTPSNICYHDPYFAQSIKNEFKCNDLQQLRRWAEGETS